MHLAYHGLLVRTNFVQCFWFVFARAIGFIASYAVSIFRRISLNSTDCNTRGFQLLELSNVQTSDLHISKRQTEIFKSSTIRTWKFLNISTCELSSWNFPIHISRQTFLNILKYHAKEAARSKAADARMARVSRQLVRTLDNPRAPLTPGVPSTLSPSPTSVYPCDYFRA